VEYVCNTILELTVFIIRVRRKAHGIAVPREPGGQGIKARAEIQQVFPGIFTLSLSGATMYHGSGKINSH